jgi:RNase P subunit RPR2
MTPRHKNSISDSTREEEQSTSLRDSISKTSLSKAKVRSKSMTCKNCQRPLFGYKHAKTLRTKFETMHRLYLKTGSNWKSIGWYCKQCGSIVLDEVKIYNRIDFPLDPGTKVPPSISALKILI